jgi:hypothetical protein
VVKGEYEKTYFGTSNCWGYSGIGLGRIGIEVFWPSCGLGFDDDKQFLIGGEGSF